jgi:hypothetical protein
MSNGNKLKTICCKYEYVGLPHPVQFNPYNNTVMCHNCGEMYVPQLDRSKEEEEIAKRVNTECRKVIVLKWATPSQFGGRLMKRCDRPKGHEGECSYLGYT